LHSTTSTKTNAQTVRNNGTEQYIVMAKTAAEAEMEKLAADYKAAQEAFDTDAILAAQEALFDAKIQNYNRHKIFVHPLYKWKKLRYNRDNNRPESVKPDEKPCAGRQKTSGSVQTGLKKLPALH
jgi:hypothetical protein